MVAHAFKDYFQNFDTRFWDAIDKPYDGYNQLMNVKLAYLERAVLTSYLMSDQSENTLIDALALHQYRSQFLNEESSSSEKAYQAMLGSVMYVISRGLNFNENEFITKFLRSNWCNPAYLSNTDNSVSILHDCMVSDQPGFVGAGYGYALDHTVLSNSWKMQLMNEAKSPESMLQNYYHMSEKEVSDRAKNAMRDTRYGFDKIDHDVDVLLKPYLNEIAIMQDRYNKLEGAELQFCDVPWLRTEASKSVEYAVNTRETLYVDKTERASMDTPDGISYTTTYDHVPVSYSDKIKLAADTKMVVDGHEYTIGDFIKAGKNTELSNLLIKNAQFSLDVKKSESELDVVDGKMQLHVHFKNNIELIPFPRTKQKQFMYLMNKMQKDNPKNKLMGMLLK